MQDLYHQPYLKDLALRTMPAARLVTILWHEVRGIQFFIKSPPADHRSTQETRVRNRKHLAVNPELPQQGQAGWDRIVVQGHGLWAYGVRV